MFNNIFHGGAVDIASDQYNIPINNWLDISTGINRISYPIRNIFNLDLQRLPLLYDLLNLYEIAKKYYKVASADHIVFSPGTQLLIQMIQHWIVSHCDIHSVHIMGFTYGEYEKEWKNTKYRIIRHHTLPQYRYDIAYDILSYNHNIVLILVNPNNPDGSLIAPDKVYKLIEKAKEHNSWILIDEAFMDCTPQYSVTPMIDTLPQTIIFRSFGKFFGLAGLRLSCLITNTKIANQLRRYIGPWAISGFGIKIGIQAFNDYQWHNTTRNRLIQSIQDLDRLILKYTKLK